MSYPSIGMDGILPEGYVWNAQTIEEMLRKGVGIHIYFEDPEDDKRLGVMDHLGVAWFKAGKFQFVSYANVRISDVGTDSGDEPKLIYETDSYIEFMTWLAVWGRDFL